MPVYPVEISQVLKETVDDKSLSSPLCEDGFSAENYFAKAITYLESSDIAAALSLFEKILVQPEDQGETVKLFKLAAKIELIFIQPIKYFNDDAFIKQLTQEVKQLPKDRLLARLFHGLAILMQWRRSTPAALKYLFSCQDIYRQINEVEGLARVLDTLGSVFASIANHEQALLFYSESLAKKIVIKDSPGQAITLGNLGRLCLQLGRYQQARSFVEQDLVLSENESDETKARLFNLLARIDIAEKKWSDAEHKLDSAIELLDPKNKDSLFFCIKDQVLLSLENNNTEGVKAKITRMTKLLPRESDYHSAHLQLVKNRFEQQNQVIDVKKAEELLSLIEGMDLPEMELDYRLWIAKLANDSGQSKRTQQHLLLCRKLAKRTGFKRYLSEISSLMLSLEITENIKEEVLKTISNNASSVEDGYLIRSKLGSGGFADVFLAHDMVNNRDVALKQLHSNDLADHKLQKRSWDQARLEFESVSGLNHPSIAKVYAIGHDVMGSPYLVQEYISGGDIGNLMQQTNSLSTALTHLIPIARALAAIHELGVIHRDVKPENILINQQGVTVLVDFGIALLKQSRFKNDQIQGTENYVAPEQKLSTDIDLSVDLFSLGCVLYEWISGEKIKIEQNQTSKLTSWLGITKTAQVSKLDKTACGNAYQLISSLVAFDPKNRPNSAGKVADMMQEILDQN